MKRILTLFAALVLVPCAFAVELETFSAKRNPKTMGVDFSIGRPKAWMTRPANPTGTFAVFWQAPSGLVDSMTLIFPRTQSAQSEDVTKEDFRTMFENPALEQMLGRSLANAKFLGKTILEDFKYPAGYIEYAGKYKLKSGEIEMKVRNYLIYLGNVMLQVQFYLVQEAGEDRLQQFDANMKQIVASLEFTQR